LHDIELEVSAMPTTSAGHTGSSAAAARRRPARGDKRTSSRSRNQQRQRPSSQALAGRASRNAQVKGSANAEKRDDSVPAKLGEGVRRFARSHPAWFLGGALVAGIALARLLKAEAPFKVEKPRQLPASPAAHTPAV
jgi:hypothetical protein